MNFKDYQLASLKHLTTCKSMLGCMNSLTNGTSTIVNTNGKNAALLHNLFYLSGYTIECIVNYSILKHYKWPDSDSVYVTNHKFSNKCQVAFYENTQRMVNMAAVSGVYTFYFSGHNFQRNIQVLQKIFSSSKIPLIDKTVVVDKDLMNLYTNWKVEIRYNPQSTNYSSVALSVDNVTRFVNLTETVYNSLMKLVG